MERRFASHWISRINGGCGCDGVLLQVCSSFSAARDLDESHPTVLVADWRYVKPKSRCLIRRPSVATHRGACMNTTLSVILVYQLPQGDINLHRIQEWKATGNKKRSITEIKEEGGSELVTGPPWFFFENVSSKGLRRKSVVRKRERKCIYVFLFDINASPTFFSSVFEVLECLQKNLSKLSRIFSRTTLFINVKH